MTTYTFDTLTYVKELVAAGMPEPRAEVISLKAKVTDGKRADHENRSKKFRTGHKGRDRSPGTIYQSRTEGSLVIHTTRFAADGAAAYP